MSPLQGAIMCGQEYHNSNWNCFVLCLVLLPYPGLNAKELYLLHYSIELRTLSLSPFYVISLLVEYCYV